MCLCLCVLGVEDMFYVDKSTGIVKLMKSLDYETTNFYRMTVRARDNGTQPLKSSCVLIVSNLSLADYISVIRVHVVS